VPNKDRCHPSHRLPRRTVTSMARQLVRHAVVAVHQACHVAGRCVGTQWLLILTVGVSACIAPDVEGINLPHSAPRRAVVARCGPLESGHPVARLSPRPGPSARFFSRLAGNAGHLGRTRDLAAHPRRRARCLSAATAPRVVPLLLRKSQRLGSGPRCGDQTARPPARTEGRSNPRIGDEEQQARARIRKGLAQAFPDLNVGTWREPTSPHTDLRRSCGPCVRRLLAVAAGGHSHAGGPCGRLRAPARAQRAASSTYHGIRSGTGHTRRAGRDYLNPCSRMFRAQVSAKDA
jgi:hypothetical protein